MRRFKTKPCVDCGAIIRATPSALRCKACARLATNRRALATSKRRHEEGLCWCSRPVELGFSRCSICRASSAIFREKTKDRRREVNRAYRFDLKMAAFAAYGNACACCTESTKEFLEIDHIGGWGTNHRDKSGRRIGGQNLFRWLRDNNYPQDTFRLLCGSCHGAISYWGYCPHEKARQATSS